MIRILKVIGTAYLANASVTEEQKTTQLRADQAGTASLYRGNTDFVVDLSKTALCLNLSPYSNVMNQCFSFEKEDLLLASPYLYKRLEKSGLLDAFMEYLQGYQSTGFIQRVSDIQSNLDKSKEANRVSLHKKQLEFIFTRFNALIESSSLEDVKILSARFPKILDMLLSPYYNYAEAFIDLKKANALEASLVLSKDDLSRVLRMGFNYAKLARAGLLDDLSLLSPTLATLALENPDNFITLKNLGAFQYLDPHLLYGALQNTLKDPVSSTHVDTRRGTVTPARVTISNSCQKLADLQIAGVLEDSGFAHLDAETKALYIKHSVILIGAKQIKDWVKSFFDFRGIGSENFLL